MRVLKTFIEERGSTARPEALGIRIVTGKPPRFVVPSLVVAATLAPLACGSDGDTAASGGVGG